MQLRLIGTAVQVIGGGVPGIMWSIQSTKEETYMTTAMMKRPVAQMRQTMNMAKLMYLVSL